MSARPHFSVFLPYIAVITVCWVDFEYRVSPADPDDPTDITLAALAT